jgi:CBS-domain-containing membrane protein
MGVQWVGKTTFSWEVWERSSTTGKVLKTFHATLDPQNSESRLPFAKIPATIAADVEAITIKQSDIQTLWNEFLERAIRAEAMRRMVDSVKSADKRTNIAATIAEEKSLQRTR